MQQIELFPSVVDANNQPQVGYKDLKTHGSCNVPIAVINGQLVPPSVSGAPTWIQLAFDF